MMLLAACGGTESATVGSPVTTTTTTTIAVTTPAPSTAAPTTTTQAPTTTTVAATTAPAADPAEAVKQAILDYEAVRFACLQEPAACDPSTYSRGRMLEVERKGAEALAGVDARPVIRDEDPGYWTFQSVELAPDGLTATVNGCRWDSNKLIRRDGLIMNDEKATLFMVVKLLNENGMWFIFEKLTDREVAEVNECGARP